MNKAYSELQQALEKMVEKINSYISEDYKGPPIKMYLAGGMAVNYYCGSRYTEDVDASFSRRFLFPANELIINYKKPDGQESNIYFDSNYNTSFALIHEDFDLNTIPWDGFKAEGNIELNLLSPLDLAISKIARYSEQDVEDILNLAMEGLFTSDDLREKAYEALEYYVGNTKSVENSINIICNKIDELTKNQSRNRDLSEK